ncbi:MAG: CPBP family intramembrane metalloprotease [Actinomycetota bacterium]|nr:MAG: CPBP family intramembrane metalloprotease [Actinomycetota bacterium]
MTEPRGGPLAGSGDRAVAGRPALPGRGTLQAEVAIVLALSIAATAVRAALSIVDSLTRGEPLSSQTAAIIVSRTPDRPWLDLAYHLVGITLALAPVALVIHLLLRTGEGPRGIGLDLSEPRRDAVRGAVLAAVVGGTGLVLYLVAYNAGLSVRIAAVAVTDAWWTVPVLVLSAAENALLEEVVVLGYLLHRLDQLGVRPAVAIGASALLRGSYHLYQGLGGFVGNLAMGVLFGVLYRRWGRTGPFIVAHTLIDTVAFVGYFFLRGKISWLP